MLVTHRGERVNESSPWICSFCSIFLFKTSTGEASEQVMETTVLFSCNSTNGSLLLCFCNN